MICDGLRVETGKSRGLLGKKTIANRYVLISAVGSRSGGLDLMIFGSNPGHRFQIGWFRSNRARGGGADAGAGTPAAAGGWKLNGVGRSSDSKMGLSWDLAVEHARGTRSPPGALFGLGEARSMEFGDNGGSGRRVMPACARSRHTGLGFGVVQGLRVVGCKHGPKQQLRRVKRGCSGWPWRRRYTQRRHADVGVARLLRCSKGDYIQRKRVTGNWWCSPSTELGRREA